MTRPEELLARAQADLDEATGQITETAARLGRGREAAPAAGSWPGDSCARCSTRWPRMRPTTGRSSAWSERAYDDPAGVRPRAGDRYGVRRSGGRDRDAGDRPRAWRSPTATRPGRWRPTGMPTFVAVSPTPRDWTADRVRSFYREYNRHMVQNLMVHEAMPGHVLQLAHARRFRDGTPVRAAFWSGSFVEGWAVYAEELMVGHGYPGEGNPDAVRMQQLKMQLRTIINTILDVRVHCAGLTGSGGDGADDRARLPGRGRGGRQVAAGAAHLRPAVHLLRGIHRGQRSGGPAARGAAGVDRAAAARRSARARITRGPAPPLAAAQRTAAAATRRRGRTR